MLINEFIITKLFSNEEIEQLVDAYLEDLRIFNQETEFDPFACIKEDNYNYKLIEILKSKGVNIDVYFKVNSEYYFESLKKIIEFIKY
jgi:hypothetical protein